MVFIKTLYIIGNGFDLAHGLSTSYWKFREYLEREHQEFLYEFEHLYDIGHIDFSDPRVSDSTIAKWEDAVGNKLWSDFEYQIGRPNIDEMLGASDCVLGDMNLDGGLIGIEDTMDAYWKEQYSYMNMFQQYVKDWIDEIDTSKIKPKFEKLINSKDIFLNFNYTDVLERVYGIENVLHIHGGVDSVTDIDPIMGHCNLDTIDEHKELAKNADDEFDEGGASIHRAVSDYLLATYKDTYSIIAQHSSFWRKLERVDHVVIFGWSAGDVDLPYIRKIRYSIDSSTVWDVYYHDKKAYLSLKASMQGEDIEDKYTVNYHADVEF